MNLDTQHWFCSPSVCGQSWQFYLNKQRCLCNCCGLDSWPAPKEKLPGKWKEKISSGYQLLTTLIQINDQTWSGLPATPLHHRPDKHTHNCWEKRRRRPRDVRCWTSPQVSSSEEDGLWSGPTPCPRLLLLFILLLLHHHPLLPPPMTIHPEIALWKRKKTFFLLFHWGSFVFVTSSASVLLPSLCRWYFTSSSSTSEGGQYFFVMAYYANKCQNNSVILSQRRAEFNLSIQHWVTLATSCLGLCLFVLNKTFLKAKMDGAQEEEEEKWRQSDLVRNAAKTHPHLHHLLHSNKKVSKNKGFFNLPSLKQQQ